MPEYSTSAKSYRLVLMPQGQFIMGYDTLTAAIAEAVRLNDQNKVKVPSGRMPYYAVLPAFTVEAARRFWDAERVGPSGHVVADALMGIEKERAKRRQAEQARQNQPQANKPNGDKNQKVESVPPSENPMSKVWAAAQERKSQKAKARDAVGEKVGVSGKTAANWTQVSNFSRGQMLHTCNIWE